MQPASVTLAATPIGNLGDASPRLREVLAEADVIAAEDTRRLRRLLQGLNVETSATVIAHHEHNEQRSTQDLLGHLAAGASVVLVSDAGMPTISDPGYRLATAAAQASYPVSVVPGPSAVLGALAVSGLATDRFCFEGFLPRKASARTQALQHLREEPRTMVFFEAPHRLAATAQSMVEAFGPERHACVVRELTKLHEEVLRAPLSEIAQRAAEGVRGEIVVVVAGAPAPQPMDLDDAVARVRSLAAEGTRLKEAAAAVASETGHSKRELYEAALERA